MKTLSFISLVLSRLAISTGNCIFNVYIAEVYPTSVRHYAFGYFGFCTKFIAIFAPPFVELCDVFNLSPFIPLSFFFFIGLFTLDKLKETLGHPLKEQLEEEESTFLQNDLIPSQHKYTSYKINPWKLNHILFFFFFFLHSLIFTCQLFIIAFT